MPFYDDDDVTILDPAFDEMDDETALAELVWALTPVEDRHVEDH